MDTVTLDGKIYVTAGKGADLVGYASDYVGQLCRKGVLDGIMLGKTWYVREESLLGHKGSKVRVNTATTRRDIQKQQRERMNILGEGHSVETKIKYSSDESDLLPPVVPQMPVQVYKERPVAADVPSVQESEEPQLIPIRIARTARGASVARTMHSVIERQSRISKTKPITRTSRHAVISYRSLVPVACLLLILFILTNIILESTWSYTNTGSKQQGNLETTYNLASVSAIRKVIREIRF